MNRITVSLLFAVAAASAFGQKADVFDLEVSNVMILQSPAIQKEVGMTEGQRSKIQGYAEAFNKKKDAFLQSEKARRDKQGKSFQPNEAKLRDIFTEFRGQVLNQLSAKQVKRLAQVTLQEVGMASMLDANVARKLGITPAQSQRLKAAYEDGTKRNAAIEQAAVAPIDKEFKNKDPKDPKMRELFNQRMAAAADKVKPSLDKIKLETRAKFRSILTAQQLAQWTALLGPTVKG